MSVRIEKTLDKNDGSIVKLITIGNKDLFSSDGYSITFWGWLIEPNKEPVYLSYPPEHLSQKMSRSEYLKNQPLIFKHVGIGQILKIFDETKKLIDQQPKFDFLVQ